MYFTPPCRQITSQFGRSQFKTVNGYNTLYSENQRLIWQNAFSLPLHFISHSTKILC